MVFSSTVSIFSDESLFTIAGDSTWKKFMENTADYVQNNGGVTNEFDNEETYGARHPYDEDGCQD